MIVAEVVPYAWPLAMLIPSTFNLHIDDIYKIIFRAHQTNHYYLTCIQTSICLSSILVIIVKLKDILLLISKDDIIIRARNNTWYAEVAAPKMNPWGNHSLLGISQGSRCSCSSSLLMVSARDLRSHLLLLFFDEDRCHDKLSPLGPMWLLRPGWALWLVRAEASRAISW